jgi:hypothetical protein
MRLPTDVDSLRAWFEAEAERRGNDPSAALSAAFGDIDEEDYWETVKTNLAAQARQAQTGQVADT